MLLIISILSVSSYLGLLWLGVILSLLIGWWSINLITGSIPQLYQELKKIRAEKIQIEDTLTKKNLELEKYNKELLQAKSDFLSTVSHELRTPLTSIKAFTQLLLSDPKEDLKSRVEFLSIINSEVDRLTSLINDLLELTEIEEGKLEYEEKELIIEEIIKSGLGAVNSLAKGKNIEIKTNIDKDIPVFIGDEEKLTLLIKHLLNNAIKFSYDNGLVEIKAKVESSKQAIQISVKDAGIGIAPENFEVIFEKFKKIDDNILTSQYQGAGLGLALCKEIVGHYKGRIWVESELKKGTTFYVTLPLLPIKVQKPLSSLAIDQPKILIVDDEPEIRHFLNFELTKQGYCVIEAVNGKEAIEQTNRFHPDLILLDILMPEVDGFETLKSLKTNSQTKDIPVIIQSIIEEKKKAYNLGARDYLTKPVDKTILLEKIQSILTTSRKNILLVSNNEKVIKILTFGLDRRGIQVNTSDNIKEAIPLTQKQGFDAVILEAKLDIDKELTNKIDIPVIILEDSKTSLSTSENKWLNSLATVVEEILKEHER